jgi:large subunit ribosomal protein L22
MQQTRKQARRENRLRKKNTAVTGEKVVAQAHMKHARFGPRKARLLADLIRNQPVHEAMRILTFAQKPSSQPTMLRLLKSAVSNVNIEEVRSDALDNLVVGEVTLDSAQVMKRFQPRAMGRIGKIRKRSCHITLRLVDRLGVLEGTGAEAVAPATAAPAPKEETTPEVEEVEEVAAAEEEEVDEVEEVEASAAEETDADEVEEVEAADDEDVEDDTEEADEEDEESDEEDDDDSDDDEEADAEDDDEKKE